jgi:hypothetical protein
LSLTYQFLFPHFRMHEPAWVNLRSPFISSKPLCLQICSETVNGVGLFPSPDIFRPWGCLDETESPKEHPWFTVHLFRSPLRRTAISPTPLETGQKSNTRAAPQLGDTSWLWYVRLQESKHCQRANSVSVTLRTVYHQRHLWEASWYQDQRLRRSLHPTSLPDSTKSKIFIQHLSWVQTSLLWIIVFWGKNRRDGRCTR